MKSCYEREINLLNFCYEDEEYVNTLISRENFFADYMYVVTYGEKFLPYLHHNIDMRFSENYKCSLSQCTKKFIWPYHFIKEYEGKIVGVKFYLSLVKKFFNEPLIKSILEKGALHCDYVEEPKVANYDYVDIIYKKLNLDKDACIYDFDLSLKALNHLELLGIYDKNDFNCINNLIFRNMSKAVKQEIIDTFRPFVSNELAKVV